MTHKKYLAGQYSVGSASRSKDSRLELEYKEFREYVKNKQVIRFYEKFGYDWYERYQNAKK